MSDGIPSRPRTIVVTGATSGYWPLLAGMLDSIAARASDSGIAIGVLDVGLDAEQRAYLGARGIAAVAPGWDYPPEIFTEAPKPFFQCMTARPHLPRHFPGYDLYLWLDADCWVQDWNAVLALRDAAWRSGLAAVEESHPRYIETYASGPVAKFRYQCLALTFDEETARRLFRFPIVNVGVFAARGDSPLWERWSARLGQVFRAKGFPFFFAEQTVFNTLVREGGIAATLMAASCNWMCNRALPLCSADGAALLLPEAPYPPLGIVHLTAQYKNGRWPLADPGGATHTRSLRFKGDEADAGPDVALPL